MQVCAVKLIYTTCIVVSLCYLHS